MWHAQITGRRIFVMFPPQATERLQARQGTMATREAREWTSPVELFSRARQCSSLPEAHLVLLEPGETLIIPAGWWQCSVALEPFTTMSRRFWNRQNRLAVCDELARLSDLRDASKSQRMRLASQLPLLREQIQEAQTSKSLPGASKDDLSSGAD